MSKPVMDPTVRGGRVQRFVPRTILFHWVYAGCWLVLMITGLGFMFESLSFLAGPTSRLLHRYAAIGLMVMPVIYFAFANRAALFHLKEVFTWTRDDLKWLSVAVPYHFVGKPKPPKQGFLNAGQKLNYLVVILTFGVFVATGLVMWLMRADLALEQRELFRWAAMLHSLAAYLGAGMFMIHIYMSGVHPFTRAAFSAMINGYVTLEYALHEHPKWAEQFSPRGGQEDKKP